MGDDQIGVYQLAAWASNRCGQTSGRLAADTVGWSIDWLSGTTILTAIDT